jgi:serine/threonine-protein kinase
MGQVYRGRRLGDVEQHAAIKVQDPLRIDADTARRFRLERQMLARLEHPAIARLIESGEDARGRAYYAMEWIDGVTIDRWCDEQRLDPRARVALFLRLCDGVDYAHRHLVVHRDLKAGNVLITRDGQPRLLDFGIAKALAADASGADTPDADATAAQARYFSPSHAAPEQVRGEAISVACDVYALGVMLYQLVCGLRPYELDGLSAAEIEQRICEAVPPPPSA